MVKMFQIVQHGGPGNYPIIHLVLVTHGLVKKLRSGVQAHKAPLID